jgi:hypothetical protein
MLYVNYHQIKDMQSVNSLSWTVFSASAAVIQPKPLLTIDNESNILVNGFHYFTAITLASLCGLDYLIFSTYPLPLVKKLYSNNLSIV